METAGNLPFHLWLWLFRWARRNVTSTTLQRSSEVLIISLRLTKNWPSRQAVLSSRILPLVPLSHHMAPPNLCKFQPWALQGHERQVPRHVNGQPGRQEAHLPRHWNLETSWAERIWEAWDNDGGCGCKAPTNSANVTVTIRCDLISTLFYYMVSKTIEKVGSFMKFQPATWIRRIVEILFHPRMHSNLALLL